MKLFIILCSLFCSAAVFAAGESVVAVPDDTASVVIKTADGKTSQESVKDVIANYPQLKAATLAEVAKKMDAEDETKAAQRMARLLGMGVSLPLTTTDKLAARAVKFLQKKEAALLKVKDTDPLRAKLKMSELVEAGWNISAATQSAVNAAQPSPTPGQALPSPTPDGL